jgi:hypothetical protein
LIGSQRRLQGLARVDFGQAAGAPTSLERGGEPGTGLDTNALMTAMAQQEAGELLTRLPHRAHCRQSRAHQTNRGAAL